ncbi:MAG: hypothetical protein OEX97_04125 [Acidimicrobiia bacterium]|nr:hypothetical protein [Acidimicrobiia bacterium]
MGNNDPISEAGRLRAALLDAAAGLEFAISSPSGQGAAWGERVDDQLQLLRSALLDHTGAVESDDGLLADIVRQAPRLSNRVKLMKREHEQMDARIVELVQMVGAVAPDELEEATETIREATLELLGTLSRHRQKGADLVYRAFAVDIGGVG